MKLAVIVFNVFYVSYVFGNNTVYKVPDGDCAQPLGMEKGRIPDDAITATSSFEPKSVGPHSSRIRNEKLGGAWCPKSLISEDSKEYLEINLNQTHLVTYTETQGRFGNGHGIEYTETFNLEYWRSSLNQWVLYRDIRNNDLLTGNSDTASPHLQKLDLPFVASKVRFVPVSHHPRTVCLRVEMYGCPLEEAIASYSMPQPDTEFTDMSYDGVSDGKILRGGLGQLIDGIFGTSDFLDHNDPLNHEHAKRWIGWSQEGINGGPLEINFEFGSYREITIIRVHASHFKTREIQVFATAEVLYCMDDDYYFASRVLMYPDLKRAKLGANTITLRVLIRLALKVKLKLYFADRWLLISEITFESNRVQGNLTKQIIEEFKEREKNVEQKKQLAETIDDSDIDDFGEEDRKTEEKGKTSIINRITLITIGSGVAVLTVAAIICAATILTMKYRKRNNRRRFSAGFDAVTFNAADSTARAIKLEELHVPTEINSQGFAVPPVSFSSCRTSLCKHPNSAMVPIHQLPYTRLSTNISTISGGKSLTNIYADIQQSETESAIYHEPYMHTPFKRGKCTRSGREKSSENPFSSRCNRSGSTRITEKGKENNDANFKRGDHGSSSLHNLARTSPVRTPPPLPSRRNAIQLDHFKRATFNTSIPESLDNYAYDSPDHFIPSRLRHKIRKTEYTPMILPQAMWNNKTTFITPGFPGLTEIDENRLSLISEIGEGDFGMVRLCSGANVHWPKEYSSNYTRKVVVKTLRNASETEKKNDFIAEALVLSTIINPNVCRIFGIFCKHQSYGMVQEFQEYGELPLFFKQQIELGIEASALISKNYLVYYATQIASGLKYLESMFIVHRDVAARNCVIGSDSIVKISDHAMYSVAFSEDYYISKKNGRIPLRWTSCEGIITGKYTSKGDVWAFGVTLWEIFNLCIEKPYSKMSNDEFVENCHQLYENVENPRFLERPTICPRDIYGLMRECWNKNEKERPTFSEIYLFLQRKNLNFVPPPPSFI